MKQVEPLDDDVATELLKRLIDYSETSFNRINGNGKEHVDDEIFIQSDLIHACLHGRVIGHNGVSSNPSFYKYLVRSNSLQHEGRFVELEVIMGANPKTIKCLSAAILD